jgi:hypothetical protein
VFRRLKYQDIGLWRIETEGFDESDVPVTVVGAQHIGETDDAQPPGAPPGGGEDLRGGGEEETDLMGIFDAQPRATGARQAKAKRQQGSEERALGEAEVTVSPEDDVYAAVAADLGLSPADLKGLAREDLSLVAEVCSPEEVISLKRCLRELHEFSVEAEGFVGAEAAAETETEEDAAGVASGSRGPMAMGREQPGGASGSTGPAAMGREQPRAASGSTGPTTMGREQSGAASGSTGPKATARETAKEGESAAAPGRLLPPRVVVLPGWTFADDQGNRLGNIRAFQGTYLKGLCARHARCACWLSYGGASSLERAEKDLIWWLAEDAGPAEHAASAQQLKRKHASIAG